MTKDTNNELIKQLEEQESKRQIVANLMGNLKVDEVIKLIHNLYKNKE